MICEICGKDVSRFTICDECDKYSCEDCMTTDEKGFPTICKECKAKKRLTYCMKPTSVFVRPKPRVDVECPKGHRYPVAIRFHRRAVRKKRELVCPRCLTSFKAGFK